jgi:hypothetical protein
VSLVASTMTLLVLAATTAMTWVVATEFGLGVPERFLWAMVVTAIWAMDMRLDGRRCFGLGVCHAGYSGIIFGFTNASLL